MMPLSIKEILRRSLFDALTSIGITELAQEDVVVERAPEYTNADYATSVAFIAAPYKGTNPRGVAEDLIKALRERSDTGNILADVHVAGAGFINLYVSHACLKGEFEKALGEGEKFGKGDLYQGKKVIIEFTDPNPFKEFHVGHLYSNTVGEALARLFEWQGATVKRADYYGDVGMHVAKALWGAQAKMHEEAMTLEVLEQKPLKTRIAFWGEAYAKGAEAFEKEENAKQEIALLNTKVYQNDPAIWELYEKGKAWSLEYFEEIYRRLGTHFDYYFPESEMANRGLALVGEYAKKGVFEQSNGAIVFPGERYGLHTRVMVNSMGLPTYEAKELGLAFTKYERFPYDQSIIITANEVDSYFAVLLKALQEISPELAAKTRHLSHGMVRLPQGKMSSRKGNVITAQSLLDEAKVRALLLIESSAGPLEAKLSVLRRQSKDMKSEEKDDIAEKVAVAAVKYALLKHSLGHNIVFSFDEAITFEGDSGPYLQYTYARTQSVLARSEKSHEGEKSWEELNKSELALARAILRFPETAMSAAQHYAPHSLCAFLFDLAKNFNTFYGANRIARSGSEEAKRIALTKATGIVLQNGLWLLGIGAPQAM